MRRKMNADYLRSCGYVYKMEVLTKAEKDELKNGRKATLDGNKVRLESRDFNYYYKELPGGAEVQIFVVGDKLYYRNVWVRKIKQLPLIEKDAETTKVYGDLQAQVVDTKPKPYNEPVLTTGQSFHSRVEGWVKLVGGPMDGQVHKWQFPSFIGQYDEGGVTKAARYIRDDMDKRKDFPGEDKTKTRDKTLYNFLMILQ